ncbi:MAG TPA: hypothetical protein PLT66_03315 [Bacillota bacterium]|nr:hypothetical protein [Bacillota bacterium]
MKTDITSENRKKRIKLPVTLLMCYSLFTAWQMGVVFFSGRALSLDGKTPLPINAEGMTFFIIAAYILSIVFLIFF